MNQFVNETYLVKMSEKFSLKWNDFHSNLSKLFSLLRNDENFHDVTLFSDDQQQFHAHKVVLSASSTFFQNILKNTRNSNPFLCLEGVNSKELNFVLDYIYQGEVQIHQEQLERFLAIAQRFKLEGLMEQETGNEKSEQQHKQESKDHEELHSQIYDVSKVESLKRPRSFEIDNAIAKIDASNSTSVDDVEERVIELLIKNDDGTFGCRHCGKSGTKLSRNMKNHIETHLDGISFTCSVCGKNFRSRNSLNNHRTLFHKTLSLS